MDGIEKEILAVLSKYPEGLGYRELHRKLKDERGRNLVAFLTLQRKVDKLSKDGCVEIVEEDWKQGKKKIIKLRDSHKIIAKKLSEIRAYINLFKKYIVKHCIPILIRINGYPEFYHKLAAARYLLLEELEEKTYEIFESDISIDLKKELLFEVFEVEKEINTVFISTVFENEEELGSPLLKHLRRFIKAYPFSKVRFELEELKKEVLGNEIGW